MKIQELSIAQLQEGLRQKEFTAKEVVQDTFKHIQKEDTKIHAFLSLAKDLALRQAKETDERIAKGQNLLPLSGVPCSVKDAILVQGELCTAGSRILKDYVAPYDATVIRKIKEAGAVIVGKTNMDEFSMGASTENSAFGPTLNPADTEKVPGGSSGGSAADVAMGGSIVSLGEDTGGSIRQPASFCGVIGLKPTYGAVSRYGIIALASSLDQVGPFARNIEDVETLFHVIQGKDSYDATSLETQKQKKGQKLKSLRIGVPKEYFAQGLDPQVEKVIQNAIQKFANQGAKIEELELPHTKYALAAYYVINMSEASANLARYDGIRYGLSKDAKELLDVYLESRGEGLGKEVKRRIMLGTYALSAGYYDAYYVKAQKVRALLKQDFDKAFKKVDVIMGPTSPVLPFKLGERSADPLAMYLVDVYTVPVNLVGLPALSIPAGKVGNLPVGLHVIAPALGEDVLFQVGKMFESV
tara:strand:- start:1190 stop:2602 length:1413 start_codon:yes stop_codon:yes gene_type:complete